MSIYQNGALGEIRTLTVSRRNLNPVRLPIPPPGQKNLNNLGVTGGYRPH